VGEADDLRSLLPGHWREREGSSGRRLRSPCRSWRLQSQGQRRFSKAKRLFLCFPMKLPPAHSNPSCLYVKLAGIALIPNYSVSVGSECIQEREHGSTLLGWYPFSRKASLLQRLSFKGQAFGEVNLSCLYLLMSEPQRDDLHVNTAVE